MKIKNKINSIYKVTRNREIFVGENFLWEKGVMTEIRYSNGARKRSVDFPT